MITTDLSSFIEVATAAFVDKLEVLSQSKAQVLANVILLVQSFLFRSVAVALLFRVVLSGEGHKHHI